ncbi:hypothetical protein EAN96_27355 [Klebsiella pneumoniae]|nr:hypothetical protein EAN96_27355 [Klebsiella pneumoniae]
MEEKKHTGWSWCLSGCLSLSRQHNVVQPVADRQVNAFMTTNRAWGIQCDTVSQAAWVVRDGERVDLQINHLPLYCSGYRFEARDDAGKIQRQLDKYSVYQHLSRQSQ